MQGQDFLVSNGVEDPVGELTPRYPAFGLRESLCTIVARSMRPNVLEFLGSPVTMLVLIRVPARRSNAAFRAS